MTDETSVVVLHDDEYCLRPEVLQSICEITTRSNSSLYSGNFLWSYAKQEQQYGFEGSFAPYFSGHLYALSADLLKDIVHEDSRAVFTSNNLGYSEDLQVGKWVKNQADRKDRPRNIEYVTMSQLGL